MQGNPTRWCEVPLILFCHPSIKNSPRNDLGIAEQLRTAGRGLLLFGVGVAVWLIGLVIPTATRLFQLGLPRACSEVRNF